MLLLLLENDNSDKDIMWEVENLMKTIFGDVPQKKHDYKKLAEWKFPQCPLSEFQKQTDN